jgi:hypothetical protein
MPSYLDRYRLGEHEQVWEELLALGGLIRQPPLYDQALAVARETMTRARANIELLVPRLNALGYRFAHPDRAFVPADEETRRLAEQVEKRAGPMPLSLQVWFEDVGEVNFMGVHPKLSTYVQSPDAQHTAQDFLSLFTKYGGSPVAPGDSLRQGVDLSLRLLTEMTQRLKTGQPRSREMDAGVRASMEIVQRLQRPAAPEGPEEYTDPLVVEPYFGDLEDSLGHGENDVDAGEADMDDTGPYDVIIAPDAVHKTNHSGGQPYTIAIPNPAIDAALEGDEEYGTFIQYLRTCFRWGGFPGLRASAKQPREELDYLTQGLSPI